MHETKLIFTTFSKSQIHLVSKQLQLEAIICPSTTKDRAVNPQPQQGQRGLRLLPSSSQNILIQFIDVTVLESSSLAAITIE